MSIILDILKEMYDKELNYKGYRCNIFGIPKLSTYEKKALRLAINRLKRLAYISSDEDGWIITKSGQEYFIKKRKILKQFDSSFKLNSPRNLLLTFDIPELRKYEREWLRRHLEKFNYKLIQRSVWVGPSPLPKDFVEYLKEIKLSKCIKTYKFSKYQIV
jgi:DNA-binding transcriptional regulator PaaX